MNKRLVATLFLYLSFLLPAGNAAAAEFQPDQLHAHLRQGIESAFNLDHTDAFASFRKAVELDRESPTGYAFLALAHLFSYETSFDPKEREKSREAMVRYVGDAVARGEKRVGENPRNGHAYFALTLAKIVNIRLALMQKSYIKAAQQSAIAWGYVEKTRAADPNNYDNYFPMGLFHYHIDQLPGVTRLLSSLLITTGDRHKGIQELELAVQKGDLLRELAQTELASVYDHFEKQPAKALPITMELKERFPRNYNFSFSLANILSELGRFDEAYAIAEDMRKGIRDGKPPFAPQIQPRYELLLGRILFNQREYDRAGEYFQKVLKDTAVYNARTRAAALLRLGMIHDIRQERKRAKEYYDRVLEVEGGEGAAQVEARRYLKEPCILSPSNPGL
jgi:tetratricopeptide (TPR) repeat protein